MKVQETLTLTVDGVQYNVAEQSDEIKQMVVYLDEWRQDEADEATMLIKTRAAIRDLQNTIVQQLQKEKTKANEAASDIDSTVVQS